MQGIVGGMPWIAMGYITMFLQLLGFTDWLAGLLTALFWGGTVVGNLLGGVAGDLLVRCLPDAGAPHLPGVLKQGYERSWKACCLGWREIYLHAAC